MQDPTATPGQAAGGGRACSPAGQPHRFSVSQCQDCCRPWLRIQSGHHIHCLYGHGSLDLLEHCAHLQPFLLNYCPCMDLSSHLPLEASCESQFDCTMTSFMSLSCTQVTPAAHCPCKLLSRCSQACLSGAMLTSFFKQQKGNCRNLLIPGSVFQDSQDHMLVNACVHFGIMAWLLLIMTASSIVGALTRGLWPCSYFCSFVYMPTTSIPGTKQVCLLTAAALAHSKPVRFKPQGSSQYRVFA